MPDTISLDANFPLVDFHDRKGPVGMARGFVAVGQGLVGDVVDAVDFLMIIAMAVSGHAHQDTGGILDHLSDTCSLSMVERWEIPVIALWWRRIFGCVVEGDVAEEKAGIAVRGQVVFQPGKIPIRDHQDFIFGQSDRRIPEDQMKTLEIKAVGFTGNAKDIGVILPGQIPEIMIAMNRVFWHGQRVEPLLELFKIEEVILVALVDNPVTHIHGEVGLAFVSNPDETVNQAGGVSPLFTPGIKAVMNVCDDSETQRGRLWFPTRQFSSGPSRTTGQHSPS